MGGFLNKRDFLRMPGSAAVAAPATALTVEALQKPQSDAVLSTYDRVMQTRTIRCGYDSWPPIIMRDLNTGKLSGIFYDYMENIGRNLGLRVEWINVTWASYFSDLKSGRIDAMCAGVWPVGNVISMVDFTPPLYYVDINVYVREGDKRFDHDISTLNDAKYTIADIDGLVPARIAAQDFPKAQTLSLPQTAPSSDMLLSVATGKADATFTDIVTANNFMKHNPGTLRQVPRASPLRSFGNTVAVAKNEDVFLRMLIYATEELQNGDVIEKLLREYETYPHSLRRVAKPYGN